MVEEEDRMLWKGKFEFLFTSFGFTIGLGNVWRFPERCYRNGGGAFLFPYLLTAALCTIPMTFLEMCLGQFSSEGPIRVWKISPAFVGVGWAIMFVVFITSIYYVTPIMYALYYMLVSFVNVGGTLPWQQCRLVDDWSTKECLSGNTTAEEEYWNRFVLGQHESDGVHDLGGVIPRNVCLLLVMWVIIYYCCVRGIRSIAKVIYVTATFPFGIIIILLVRGMTLTGYEDGIAYYLQADWSKMSDMNIWSSAANQAIFSLSIAYGGHIALASHNRFKNNVFRDAIIIGVINTITSFLLGLIVFSFLGHASHTLKIPIEDMIDQGPGLLFISYLQGVTQLPGAPIWCVLFFLMVFTLGLDSLFVQVWTMASCFEDSFPMIDKRYKRLILVGLCLLMFLLGIPLVTKGGIHMIVLMDRYVADIGLAALLMCESVSVCWVYGLKNFIRDVELMIGHKSKHFWWYWKLTWMVTSPLFSVFIFVASCVGYQPSSYRGKETPAGGEVIGWLIIVTPLVIVAVCAVIQVRRYNGLKAALNTSDRWRPRRQEDRTDHYDNNNIRLETNNVLVLDSVDKIETEAGFQTGEQGYTLANDELPPASPCSGSMAGQSPGIDFAGNCFAQHNMVETSITQGQELDMKCVTVPSDSTFDSFDAADSGWSEIPTTPHRTNTYIEDIELANKEVHDRGESKEDPLPHDGYITPIAKRPAPSIPNPIRCGSDTITS